MFQIPRGTRDFSPEDMQKRRYVENQMRTLFTQFGYGEVQTPTFENLELFTAKSGEAIIDELYAFKDKGGRELALRPELTAPVIRYYVENLQMEPKPLKLFYFGNCYRYDRPQKGRYREFQQAGCELIGPDTIEANAELIALAYSLLQQVGLKNIGLNIGNLTLIKALFTKLDISKQDQQQLLPFIDKSEFNDLSVYLEKLGIPPEQIEQVIDLLQTSDFTVISEFFKDDSDALEQIEKTRKVFTLLQASFSIKKCQFNLGIVRGLDYYKGLVFEIEAPVLSAEKQLCGGGVYDLVGLFGGSDVATSGFAIGFDRTILALEAESFSFPTQTTKVFVIPINEDVIPDCITLLQKLRKEQITADIDLMRRGIGKALKYANAKKIPYSVLVGPKELIQNTVTLRDMNTGDQQNISVNELTKTLQKF